MTTTTDTPNKTVRTTVDLAPELHLELRTWCLHAGVRATQAGVLRALAARLLRDPELSAAIKADLSPSQT
ncbi:hypothetical protein ABZS29_38410 [Kribbella sp. NPDC005582]|uniref:hypothetical protein n=1 Tax=Kribbella sp. NPDC005582 TaxID=3156893 RepID=UPI0033A2A69D